MKGNMRSLLLAVLGVILIVSFSGYAFAESETKPVTVVGTIDEDNTITDEAGAIYQIMENEKGDELAEHVGQKVEIKGMLEEAGDGSMTITVETYKLVE